MKTINKFAFLFACLLFVQIMNAKVINSGMSGSWTDPSTWEGNAVPTSSDMVNIKSGHIVTYYVNSPTNLAPIEICRSLHIEKGASFYASNLQPQNLQFNFRGDVVCDGTIDLGQQGPKVSGAIFGFIAGSKSFSGTGSANLKALQHWGWTSTIFTVSIPTITLSVGLFEMGLKGTLKVASGTTIEPKQGATVQMCCGPYDIGGTNNPKPTNPGGKFEILGKVTVNKLYVANRAASGGDKSQITIKNGGELTVTSTITTKIGTESSAGTGMIFTVEAGGKFNYPNSYNPLDFTNSSHQYYDPNLSVIYKPGSIINGIVTQ